MSSTMLRKNFRIKKLIKGRDAYIVPGVLNHDDLHIADVLNVPVLGKHLIFKFSNVNNLMRLFFFIVS